MWCNPIPRHLRFHDLRHTTATLILAHGGTLWEVQKILGHSDPNITAKVYAHLVPGFLETAVNRLPIGKRATPNTAVGAHAAHRFGSPWSATRSRRQKAKARPRENLLREPGLWFGCGGLQLVVAYDSGDVRASGRLEPGLQILLLSRDFTNRADRGENPSPV